MTIKNAIQLAIDDHRSYAANINDYEFIDALQRALTRIEQNTKLLEALKLFISIYPEKVKLHPDIKIAIENAETIISEIERNNE